MIKRTEILLGGLLVLLDLATKVAANSLLPYEEYVAVWGEHIYFNLCYNFDGVNSTAGRIMEGDPNPALLPLNASIIQVFIIAYFFLVKNKPLKLSSKILRGIGLSMLVVIFLTIVTSILPLPLIPIEPVMLLGRVTSLMLLSVLLFHISNRLLRFGLLLCIAGGLGNLLSYCYPPFHVIDFIYSQTANNIRGMGIFNLADVTIEIGYALCIISIIWLTIKAFYNKFIRSQKPAEELPSSAD